MRNLRASGEGRLLLGRRSETFTAVELDDADKAPLLRAYLKRWKAEVGVVLRRRRTRLVRGGAASGGVQASGVPAFLRRLMIAAVPAERIAAGSALAFPAS